MTGCQQTNPLACQAVREVNASSNCDHSSEGLVLIAKNVAQTTSLTWMIAPFRDTLIQGGQTYQARYFSTTANRLTLPDNIAERYPKIGIMVGPQDCASSTQLYFSFVKRLKPGTSCAVWQKQEKFVVGD